ncbi:cysteine biosynthesis protein CysZ [Roseomonas eburnea]|uniref:Cysteine biosynthesis protein CysZ n=2 Tax=Neoroseomonas eburnea TaxID=1346889 RepID=A0A9X9XBG3_9PROT|nr:EI24 domain-containing protein [Neoroseomonas eburnea]MBR0681049.1 cysteine biosynthesis protein CysZ [Neoroseomonas eburnea]
MLALGQMGDPAFRRPLLFGVLGAAVALGLLTWGAIEAAAWAAGGTGWLSWLAQLGGGAAALVMAWWLFLPVAAAIASQLVEPVAAAVERRHYPGLPPPQGASIVAQVAFGLRFGLKLLALQLVMLPLLFVPVLGFVLALTVSAYALGAGMVQQTALLRMDGAGARAAWRRLRVAGWLLGMALAAMALVPLLNLLVPILGTAAAVHLLQRSTRS